MIYLFLEHINMLLYKVVTTSTTINTVFIIAIERIFFLKSKMVTIDPKSDHFFSNRKKWWEFVAGKYFYKLSKYSQKEKKIGFHHWNVYSMR